MPVSQGQSFEGLHQAKKPWRADHHRPAPGWTWGKTAAEQLAKQNRSAEVDAQIAQFNIENSLPKSVDKTETTCSNSTQSNSPASTGANPTGQSRPASTSS